MDAYVNRYIDLTIVMVIDWYTQDNNNGLGLTTDDAIDYVTFLANAAHDCNLSIGVKNAGAVSLFP